MINQTYAEMQGKEVFDWNEFLNKKDITVEEWKNASVLSSRWVTCACGVQCGVIPRLDDGGPLDAILMNEGLDFLGNIKRRNITQAKLTLIEIEKRSAYLIDQIECKNYFKKLFNKVKNYIK